MGKKKTKTVNSLYEKAIKEFGDNVVIGADTFVDKPRRTLSVSPNLDMILGSGIPEGSFVTLTGPAKVGKTSLAVHFAVKAQAAKLEDGSTREVFFYNIEGRLKVRDLEGIPGLDFKHFHIIESTKGNILSGEKYLSMAADYIMTVPNSIHIIDSYSALCTDTELTSGMDQMQRADGPKLLAKFCRKISNTVPVNEVVLIGITHLMGNPSGMGAPLKEKSGNAIAYQVDVKLWGRYAEKWCIPKDSDNQIGQKIHWECMSSAISSPGRKTVSYLRYGEGIDEAQETFELAKDIGLIKQSGSWFKFEFLEANDKGEYPTYQGAEKARQALIENDNEKLDILRLKIKELVG